MANSAKIVLFASLGLVIASSAGAEPAAAPPADRCEGTLCDLYYGSRGNTADTTAKPASASVAGVPAGATPIMVPSSGTLLSGNPLSRWFGGNSSSGTASARPVTPSEPDATASNSYMHLGTGGLLGDKHERCTGTLCDTFYGSSPTEPAATGSGQQQASATPAAAAEPVIAYRHIPHESETRPKCSSPAADPWRCFRK